MLFICGFGIFKLHAETRSKSLNIASSDTVSHTTYYKRALAKEKYGDWQGVLADLNDAIRIKPLPEYYNFRALVYAHLLDYSAAHRDFDRAISLNPGYGTAHYNKGMLFYNQHLTSNACAEMRKASSANSSDANVFLREFCE